MAKHVRRIYHRFKKRHHKKPGFTIPLAVVAGIGAGSFEPIYTGIVTKNWQYTAQGLMKHYTGVDVVGHTFSLSHLQYGLLPLVVGVMVHKLASMLGINRAMSRIPIIRI